MTLAPFILRPSVLFDQKYLCYRLRIQDEPQSFSIAHICEFPLYAKFKLRNLPKIVDIYTSLLWIGVRFGKCSLY
jgi:hypothetical protein